MTIMMLCDADDDDYDDDKDEEEEYEDIFLGLCRQSCARSFPVAGYRPISRYISCKA